MRPRAAVTHAIVLAVPITPQVPDYNRVSYSLNSLFGAYCGSKFIVYRSDVFNIDETRPVSCPIIPTISARPDARSSV
jgi:hypothetical protein